MLCLHRPLFSHSFVCQRVRNQGITETRNISGIARSPMSGRSLDFFVISFIIHFFSPPPGVRSPTTCVTRDKYHSDVLSAVLNAGNVRRPTLVITDNCVAACAPRNSMNPGLRWLERRKTSLVRSLTMEAGCEESRKWPSTRSWPDMLSAMGRRAGCSAVHLSLMCGGDSLVFAASSFVFFAEIDGPPTALDRCRIREGFILKGSAHGRRQRAGNHAGRLGVGKPSRPADRTGQFAAGRAQAQQSGCRGRDTPRSRPEHSQRRQVAGRGKCKGLAAARNEVGDATARIARPIGPDPTAGGSSSGASSEVENFPCV